MSAANLAPPAAKQWRTRSALQRELGLPWYVLDTMVKQNLVRSRVLPGTKLPQVDRQSVVDYLASIEMEPAKP